MKIKRREGERKKEAGDERKAEQKRREMGRGGKREEREGW